MSWAICGAGVFFCLSGVYMFYKNVFEENRALKWPVIIILMGILLVAYGTAKHFKLVA